MKEKKSKIGKIGLSLLIAVFFMIPTGIMATDSEGSSSDAGTTQMTSFGQSGNIGSLGNGGWPVQITDVNILNTAPTGEKNVNITLLRPEYTVAETPTLGAFDSSKYTALPFAVTDVDSASHVDTSDMLYREDGTTFPGSWGDFELKLQTFSNTGTIKMTINNPAANNGRWDTAGEGLFFYRDYNEDGVVDWALVYRYGGTYEHWTYDGSLWTQSGSIPTVFTTVNYDTGADEFVVEWTTTGSANGRVAAYLLEIQPTNPPATDHLYMCVPWASFDNVEFRPDEDDTSAYLDLPSFISLDTQPYMAADCTDIYWLFESQDASIDKVTLTIDGTPYIFDSNGPDCFGLGTDTVEIRISRSTLGLSACLDDTFAFDYKLEHLSAYHLVTEESIPDTMVECVIAHDFDCLCAEFKAFVDIYRLDNMPVENMRCSDFELDNLADIYNNWEAVDDVNYDPDPSDGNSGSGAIDTWALSDTQSHSPSHSFHNSQLDDTYYGNQRDYLVTHIENTEDYSAVTVDFWQWCEGEEVEDVLHDYGYVEYNLDGAGWLPLNGEYYYDNTTWENKVVEIPESTSGVSDIAVRFVWTSGPIIQNEGWYIDDVCFFGQKDPVLDDGAPWQSHSIDVVQMCEETMTYQFPHTWLPEEGAEYLIKVWILVEDDCHYAMAPGTQADRFEKTIKIENINDAAVIANSYDGTSPFDLGDDLVVHTTVKNTGNVDLIDLPVTFSIKEQISENVLEDYVESGDSLWEDFGIVSPYTGDTWTISDSNYYSPTHSWTSSNGAGYDECNQGKLTVDTFDLFDPNMLSFDLQFMINSNLELTPDTGVTVIAMAVSYYWDLSYDAGRAPTFTGSTGGWTPFSANDFIANNDLYWEYYGASDNLVGFFTKLNNVWGSGGAGIEDFSELQFGWVQESPSSGLSGGGTWIDNLKIVTVRSGAERFKEVKIIDELKAATSTTLAETEDLEFTWENMPTGDFVESKTIPNDYDLDNNEMSGIFVVDTKIATWDPEYVESYDLSTVDEETYGYWHIQTSNYDNYVWCGDDETGAYGNDWDDLLYLAPDGDINLDAAGSILNFEFDQFVEIEGGYEYGWIEVRPYAGETCYDWYESSWYVTGQLGWTHESFSLTPSDFYNPTCGYASTLQDDIGAFTDNLSIRFRFASDPSFIDSRGWMMDSIQVTNGAGDVFALDECDTMDNFVVDGVYAGDYWREDTGFGGWICQDRYCPIIPHNLNDALVWETGVPQAMKAHITFEHEMNIINNADSNDQVFLEFSTDGGSSWVAPVAFTGDTGGVVQVGPIDITAFISDNLLVRWRVITDDNINSIIYRVRNVEITGQIDVNPPIVSATLSGTSIHGWYSSPVTVTITATDDVSGVGEIKYKIDGGAALTYTGPITISVNGEHYVEYWAIDNVGNECEHKVTPTFKIDTGDAPSVSITAPDVGIYLFGNKILSAGSKPIIIGGFTVEATASDSDSGVYRVQFELDGEVFGEATVAPYTAYCGLKHTGAGTVKAIAEDFTGNTAEDSLGVTYFKFL